MFRYLRYSILAILLLLLSAFDLQGEGADSPNSFQSGEWFRFRIHFGFLNASYATLSLQEERLKGKEVYHVVGKGSTTGFARWFFKVDDNYETYFDKYTGKPYRFIRKIDEGGYTKDLVIDFNHDANNALITNRKHNTKRIIETTEGVQDLLSGFYYLRNNYDTESLTRGDEVVMDLLYDDDDDVFKFKLKYLGREVLQTKFGKVRCLKFRPYVYSGRVFKEEESLTLWVSDDENKVPVRIKADLMVGSLKADLDAFKGLKYQFKILM
ncbi:DUF3108 domain-containing protein [Robertkochia marina]|uniref:DUF3108 domain-containing protein n=1 Tax=Robertkochia marina TaxID=1227945 RepID=A0A4S3M3Q4_9FLAO|nr:DUF3108 domain-containing protein [Robertkochia marina]THD69510.1 DUF3108 domain-containing protein [Robertkochia marina]TRZ47231.1 DUF3108 domain-containing protein [Robertkochia marina]